MSYSLYLYPFGAHRALDRESIRDYLMQIEFAELSMDSDTLTAGSMLMQHITYMGCSPALTDAQSANEIHLHLFNQMTGLGGESIETLRYPGCKHPLTDPKSLLSHSAESRWSCSQCENTGMISDINWRKSAAYSDIFIEISGIFPKEAIPSDQFIQSLMQWSKSEWHWFYSSSSA